MAAHMGDFAKNHMKRHGWKSGSGLGRNEDGISEAIKVKIKRDSAGVGHDAAEQFTFHWWDHVFNKAASNILVKNNEDGVEVHEKVKGSDMISNAKPVKSSSKEALYGMFVKSAMLTTDGEKPVSSSSEDEEEFKPIDFSSGLADDELFKACGGRTAHKGARHGLKLSAKLQRLQEQERSLKETGKIEECIDIGDEDIPRKKKKKKKSKKSDNVINAEDPIDDFQIENKKKKRKNRTVDECIDDSILLKSEDVETTKRGMDEKSEDDETTKRGMDEKSEDDETTKRGMDEKSEDDETTKRGMDEKSEDRKRKKSKHKGFEPEDVGEKSKKNFGGKESSSVEEGEVISEENLVVPKKKKKKKKRKQNVDD